MLRVFIVDDEENDRARLRECLSYFAGEENVFFEVREFSTGTELLESYTPDCDIVFLDIEMPGLSGIETARELRSRDASVLIIFVTSMAQYAIDGYEVDALDYILKPINRYSFALKLKRAVARAVKGNDDCVTVRAAGETVSLKVASIKYLEVMGHYVVFHTADGDYTEYTTLKDAERRIGKEHFARISRSYLVNLRYVTGVSKDTVTVGGDRLFISRPQKKAFLSALNSFMGGRE